MASPQRPVFAATTNSRTSLVGLLLALAVGTVAALIVAASPAFAATFSPTTTADELNGTGQQSLREAIAAANADGAASTIDLAAGQTYVLNLCAPGAIDHSTNDTGSLVHTEPFDLTINGNGATIQQTCTGERALRHDDAATRITVNDVTLTGGTVDEVSPDFENPLGGGGLLSLGSATVTGSTITANTSADSGAGLAVTRQLVMSNSTVTNNQHITGGSDPVGGMWVGGNYAGGVPASTVSGSTITDNTGHGAFFNYRGSAFTSTTIADNTGSGYVGNIASVTFADSHVDNNGGRGAGGIDAGVIATNSTFSGNGSHGLTSTGSGGFDLNAVTVANNGEHGMRFIGCNANEGQIIIELQNGTSVSGNAGSGIHHDGCGITEIHNSTVAGNAAGLECFCQGIEIAGSLIDGNSPNGGVVFRPADFDFSRGGFPLDIADSTVSNNTGPQGGGIDAARQVAGLEPAVSIEFSSVTNNTATSGNGGGVRVRNGSLAILVSDVDDNTATGDGGGAYVYFGIASIINAGFDGNSAGDDGGGFAHGGPYYSDATVSGSAFRNNSAVGRGGGAYSGANTTVETSEFSDNSSSAQGGGIAVNDGEFALRSTEVTNNTSGAVGGGVFYHDNVLPAHPVDLAQSSITNNTGPGGAGVHATTRNLQPILVTNATVSGNIGNGIEAGWRTIVRLDMATLYANTANNVVVGDQGALISDQSVIANAGGVNCVAPDYNSHGYSYSTDHTCGLFATGDVEGGADPLLGPLTAIGGYTRGHIPQTGSPLINMVPTAECSQLIDQRDDVRPQGSACETGSIELAVWVLAPVIPPRIIINPNPVIYNPPPFWFFG